MTENKIPGNDPRRSSSDSAKRKVLLFAAILGCIFLVAMWLIFRPAPVKPQEGAAGINTSVPDGKAQATVGDKRKAAEQLRSEEQQQKRMMTLGDNSFSLLDDGLKPAEEPAPADNPALRAAEANRAMQRQVQGFYTAPQRNAEVEALKRAGRSPAIPTRLRTAAARPAGVSRGAIQARTEVSRWRSGRGRRVRAAKAAEGFALVRNAARSGKRGRSLDARPAGGFHRRAQPRILTAAGRAAENQVPTVRACVAQTQVIRAGSTVQLRLLEAVRIDGVTIPRNTPLYGLATISGMRLQVTVSSVEYGGRIFAIEAAAYDFDGQPGLNVPELPRTDGPQRGTGIRRTDRRNERKRHPFGRAAGVVRAGARRIAGFIAVCRRESSAR